MKTVLLTSIGYSPNIGGIETHFDDLTKALNERGWRVVVLTYKPITTSVNAKFYEIENEGKLTIYRIPWVSGIFYKLIKYPAIEFVFLIPGLLVALPFVLLRYPEIKVVHSHGLVSGLVSVIWGKVFGKKVITTTHSIYNFPKGGSYRKIAHFIFKSSSEVLTLSKQSKEEIMSLGIDRKKISVFTYWVNLSVFRPITKARTILKMKKFTVLYVGRLVEEKGLLPLLESAKGWEKDIELLLIGSGPLSNLISQASQEVSNIKFKGKVENKKLPLYYSAADVVVVPSIHEEGFGRVILESLACGTPVIGSKRGAIPEALNDQVGILINVSSENITQAVYSIYKSNKKLVELKKKAREYAVKKYSDANVETIIKTYEKLI